MDWLQASSCVCVCALCCSPAVQARVRDLEARESRPRPRSSHDVVHALVQTPSWLSQFDWPRGDSAADSVELADAAVRATEISELVGSSGAAAAPGELAAADVRVTDIRELETESLADLEAVPGSSSEWLSRDEICWFAPVGLFRGAVCLVLVFFEFCIPHSHKVCV